MSKKFCRNETYNVFSNCKIKLRNDFTAKTVNTILIVRKTKTPTENEVIRDFLLINTSGYFVYLFSTIK
jgi:hypothetical protein